MMAGCAEWSQTQSQELETISHIRKTRNRAEKHKPDISPSLPLCKPFLPGCDCFSVSWLALGLYDQITDVSLIHFISYKPRYTDHNIRTIQLSYQDSQLEIGLLPHLII